MKHKSCHWDPGQKKIIIDGRKYIPHHQNTHPDVIVGAHLEGDNTVVVTVKEFKNRFNILIFSALIFAYLIKSWVHYFKHRNLDFA